MRAMTSDMRVEVVPGAVHIVDVRVRQPGALGISL
jgi:hypothetical protein